MEHITQEISRYVIGGFGVVPALAWNDLIKKIFSKVVPVDFGESFSGKLVYAIIITLIAWLFVKFFGKCVTFVSNYT